MRKEVTIGEQSNLPGSELVQQGLKDLAAIRVTPESLLVLIASPRLKSLGIQYPDVRLGVPLPHESRLYDLLCLRFNNEALRAIQ